jgi:hypothetical protein
MHPVAGFVGLWIVLDAADVEHILVLAVFHHESNFVITERAVVIEITRVLFYVGTF